MNRPSFFISGHSKSGTTALATFLHQHPDLFVSTPVEPNFFCPSYCRAESPSAFVPRSEAEYLSLFDPATAGQRCGEASAAYLYSAEAAERIHEFDPDARVIMIFREPADFLRSYHLQLLKNVPAEGETVADLGEAIGLEGARREGKALPDGCLIPEMLFYTQERLRYDEHYDRFRDVFPADQLLPLIYDDFRRDNLGTVVRVLEFLGVDPTFEPEVDEHNTGGSALRSRRLQALLRRTTHGGRGAAAIRRLLPTDLRRSMIDLAYRRVAFKTATPLSPGVLALIRERAQPHVAALGERLDRDLIAEWEYAESTHPTASRTAR